MCIRDSTTSSHRRRRYTCSIGTSRSEGTQTGTLVLARSRHSRQEIPLAVCYGGSASCFRNRRTASDAGHVMAAEPAAVRSARASPFPPFRCSLCSLRGPVRYCRDSVHLAHGPGGGPSGSFAAGCHHWVHSQGICSTDDLPPVSYTHLTLPT